MYGSRAGVILVSRHHPSWLPLRGAIVSAQLYYVREGQQFGPISSKKLKQFAASGWLRPHDMVWSASFPSWVPAAKVKGLFPACASPAPTPPPQAPVAKLAPPLTPVAAAALPVAVPATPARLTLHRTAVPAPDAAPAQSGGIRGWVAAAVLSVVFVGASIFLVTRFLKPQGTTAPPPDVAQQTSGSLANGDGSSGGSADSTNTDASSRPVEPVRHPVVRERSPGGVEAGGAPAEPAPKETTRPAPGPSPGPDAATLEKQRLAKQRMDAARGEFARWQKMKDFEEEQISRARRMRITPPQPDRMLAIRFNGAWMAYQEARKAYEATMSENTKATGDRAGAPREGKRRLDKTAPKGSPRSTPRPGVPVVAGEWMQLFNGKDLTGWVGEAGVWQVTDGAIFATSFPTGRKLNTFLCSTRSFRDFDLEFDCRIRGTNNSGVMIRSDLYDRTHYWLNGIKCDVGGRTGWGTLVRYNGKGGSILKSARTAEAQKRIKEDDFNRVHIRCVGKQVTVRVNDELVHEAELLQLAASGVIAFQLRYGAATEVTLKNIRARELK
jgi:hypothetical protein